MRKILFVLILILSALISVSQKIENVHAEQHDNQVKITFDITGAETDQQFDIRLLYSQNGYDWKQAIKGLTGDIGIGVSPGYWKTVTWNALEDVEKLVGKGFMFKLKATFTSKSVGIKNKEDIDNNSFSGTSGSFTDSRDGKTYKWVKIGEQIWMAENLNYKVNANSWCYNNSLENCNTYGRLYNWETANVVCPQGWYLPATEEWLELINFHGGIKEAAGKLKQHGKYWKKDENNYINEHSLFKILPGGWRKYDGNYHGIEISAYYWTASEDDFKNAFIVHIENNNEAVDYKAYFKESGFSVRCIKD